MDDNLIFLFLPVIFLLGILTSYEDIKEKKVRNVWVILSLVYSLSIIFLFSFMSFGVHHHVNQNYILSFFVNLLFSLVVGVSLWIFNLWSAGDAKLYVAYAALMPLSVYQFQGLSWFPSLVILINTFVPLLLFYFFKIMLQTSKKTKVVALKSVVNPKMMGENLVFVTIFLLIGKVFFSFIGFKESVDPFFLVAFLFLAFFLFKKQLKENAWKVAVGILTLTTIINPLLVWSVDFIKNVVFIFLLFSLVRGFILNISFDLFSTRRYIEDLTPGMILGENFEKKGRAYQKVSDSVIEGMFTKGKKQRAFEQGPLTEKEVKKIQRLHSSGKIKDHTVRVLQTISFAPFLFGGVLITLILKGSIY